MARSRDQTWLARAAVVAGFLALLWMTPPLYLSLIQIRDDHCKRYPSISPYLGCAGVDDRDGSQSVPSAKMRLQHRFSVMPLNATAQTVSVVLKKGLTAEDGVVTVSICQRNSPLQFVVGEVSFGKSGLDQILSQSVQHDLGKSVVLLLNITPTGDQSRSVAVPWNLPSMTVAGATIERDMHLTCGDIQALW